MEHAVVEIDIVTIEAADPTSWTNRSAAGWPTPRRCRSWSRSIRGRWCWRFERGRRSGQAGASPVEM